MTTLSTSEQSEQLQEVFNRLYESAANDSLQKIRSKAWEQFLELGLPTRKNEVFKYLRLRHLYSQNYDAAHVSTIEHKSIEPYIFPECTNSLIVFVNGYYQPSLSNLSGLSKKLVVSSLNDAMRTYGTFLNNHLSKSLKEETDAFAALNAALSRDGVFLYLPPKYIAEAPIQILQVIDTHNQPMLLLPRITIFAGSQSQANFATSLAYLSGRGYGINQVADIAVEEGARIHYTQVACNEALDIWHFDAVRALLKRDSHFLAVHVTQGSAAVRHDYKAVIVGENAEASLNGICMLSGNRESHTHVLVDHQAPHCRSTQLFKSALSDASRSSFEGKILVRQAAQKTDAFQLNNNLLLSDNAHADSKPNLEIFADDVKASHGATVGQLDNEQLFYMNARGFSTESAKNMLTYSFCKEVIDLIPIHSVQQQVTARAKEVIKS